MRILGAVAVCFALGGCAASRQEVVTRLGDEYIGKNVDVLVVKFGPPTSTFKLNSGQGSYVWQLSAVTDIATDRGYGTASTAYRFHDLRHHMRRICWPPEPIPKSPRNDLGHSKIGITLDLYSHVMPGMQEDAAARVDAALQAAKNTVK